MMVGRFILNSKVCERESVNHTGQFGNHLLSGFIVPRFPLWLPFIVFFLSYSKCKMLVWIDVHLVIWVSLSKTCFFKPYRWKSLKLQSPSNSTSSWKVSVLANHSRLLLNAKCLQLYEAAVVPSLFLYINVDQLHEFFLFFIFISYRSKMSLTSILSAEAIENAIKDCQGLSTFARTQVLENTG